MSASTSIVVSQGVGIVAYLLTGAATPSPTPVEDKTQMGEQEAALRRLRAPIAGMAFLGGAFFVGGGVLGTVVGLAAAGLTWRTLGAAESPATRQRRERLHRDLPVGIDLLAACLDAGGAPESSLRLVAEALGGPVADEFLAVHHRLVLGVDPALVWRDVAVHPELGPLGRAIGRANESGASITTAVRGQAAELRSRDRTEVEIRAKSIEVKAAAPLGLCFLPAFVLLGVVPLVAGIFSSMSLFG
ncbi:MAG: type II secretion system F family protein [Actinomycetota bacterium]|nr:type II secretion system F family protein [Actinomycetota bacterium]